MSQENVEIVRRLYETGYGSRTVDLPELRAVFADEFRFHTRPEFPGRRHYTLDAMPEIWADLDETYTEFSLVPTAFEAMGDFVLVTLSQSARMRGSDSRLESTIYHLWDVRGGRALEAWTFGEKAQALEAIGPSG